MALHQMALAFALVFTRVLGVFTTVPVVSEMGFPNRFKVLGGLFIAAMFFPVSTVDTSWLRADAVLMLLLGLREFAIGAGIGLVVGIIYSSFRLAGSRAGQTMGIALANVVDPLQDIEISLVGEFWYFAALAVFLAADGHIYVVRALQQSFAMAPVGALTAVSVRGMLAVMVESTAVMFILAARLMLPVVGMILVALAGMGVLGRMVPQMHVFLVGFPLMLGTGILGIYIVLPASAHLVDELLGHSTEMWGGWLRAFAAGT